MTDELNDLVRRHAIGAADSEGLFATVNDGITMVRADAPTGEMRTIYTPVVCLVLQGAKQVISGETVLRFGAGQSLIVSADVPVIGRVVAAPYLAMAVNLDMGLVREVTGQMEAVPAGKPKPDGHLFIAETDAAALDCALRLARLLDRPEAFAVLRPTIVRELHYWLLAGRHGGAIRRLAMPDGHTQRISRAVALLRTEFSRPMPVERLADVAGMSPSSFHQHFKAVTSLSPLQFQKQLRLLEARRLMLAEGCAVSEAAFEVGYESVSQFTREYGRMFGAPPRRDMEASRAA